jgi:uncharacterized protein (TIGR00251 family)
MGRGSGRPARVGLRVSPGAARSEIVGRYGEVWKVRIAARAERGRANAALLELLGEALDVSRSRLTLVSGAASRDKVVQVEGMEAAEADRLLAASRRKWDA